MVMASWCQRRVPQSEHSLQPSIAQAACLVSLKTAASVSDVTRMSQLLRHLAQGPRAHTVKPSIKNKQLQYLKIIIQRFGRVGTNFA